ncbi:hypothetical protein ROZALSC1DRAFT_23293 [Rozella allomycis CSF55]|uniref:SWIM-type domain-containing protein n=1 Tax=Rozella allomycis (strain CSF55) TaxID=988480 RepID=A0A4V1IZK5_ROZAC|nr:hypothetical protein ROZALSC1DRAFT_23293 [Rozella allomycis CSF55]
MTKCRGAKKFYCKLHPECKDKPQKTALSHYYMCKCGENCPSRYRLLFCDVCNNCAFSHNAQSHMPTDNAKSKTRLNLVATNLISQHLEKLPLEIAKFINETSEAASLSRQQNSGAKSRIKLQKGYTNKISDITNDISESKKFENSEEISENEKNEPLLFGFDEENELAVLGVGTDEDPLFIGITSLALLESWGQAFNATYGKVGTALTNNAIERFNATLKRHYTKRKRLSAVELLKRLQSVISDFGNELHYTFKNEFLLYRNYDQDTVKKAIKGINDYVVQKSTRSQNTKLTNKKKKSIVFVLDLKAASCDCRSWFYWRCCHHVLIGLALCNFNPPFSRKRI